VLRKTSILLGDISPPVSILAGWAHADKPNVFWQDNTFESVMIRPPRKPNWEMALMSNLTGRVFAWALIASCFLFEAAHSQTKPANKIGTGTVSGRVTVKGKGMPGIVVGLRTGESNRRWKPSLKGTTDVDGKYRITNVPAGSYHVVPLAPVFVSIDFPNSSPGGKALLIAEGEGVEGFDFALVRGGVVTGKVTDTEGRPVIEEFVYLAMENPSTSLPPGAIATMDAMAFQTDDRGIYRAFGLPPGRYRVSAGQGDDGFSGVGRRRPQFRRTFHPGTIDSAQAAVIDVAEATETTNIDITVARMATGVTASGKVVDSKNGEAVANLPLIITKVTVQGTSTHSSSSSIQGTNMKGEFRAEGLTPGKYTVSLSQQRENLRAEPVAFDVLDLDITGLVIKTSMGASLDGIVVFEGSLQNNVLQKLSPLFISAFVRDESPHYRPGWHATVSLNGSFHISGLQAGPLHLSLGTGDNRSRGTVISRIERDGVIQPDGIQLQSGEQVGGLRVIATHSTGAISGKVKMENGQLQPDASVFISIVKPGEQRSMMSPEVDARWHFMAEGLSSGSYEIGVTVYIPESRQRQPSSKQLVTVTDGVVSEVTITVDLNQNSRPTP
jgi:hypothetical protein